MAGPSTLCREQRDSDKVIANVGGAIDAKYRQIVLQSVVVHKPLNSSANNWSNGN